jgi:hypothetical protein
MDYTLDFFVAPLRCPSCERVNRADSSTNMATYIRAEPKLEYLGVGHPLIIEPDKMEERGYYTIREPMDAEPFRILHTWECDLCGTGFHWAEIVVDGGKIERISPVDLDRNTFERSHYIQDEARGLVSAMTGRPFSEIHDEEVVPILRKLLR